jgi:hypothetical protein
MQKHLEKELIKLAPDLYYGVRLSRNRSLMYRGFECGAGWFDLLKDASIDIETMLKKMPKKERKHHFAAHVISKRGCLRMYMSSSHPAIEARLTKLATASLGVCEKCGDEGTRAWDKTRCSTHTHENNVRIR